MKLAVSFFVPGTPRPQGSKRAFVAGGRAVMTESSGRAHKDWRAQVAHEAAEAWREPELIDGPVVLDVTFVLLRPKSRPKSRPMPDSAPDTSKLVRCIEDSLTGTVWRDDSLVVDLRARKVYGERPGAHITVSRYPTSGETSNTASAVAS